ncbi:MAG: CapA family protein [Candidatus Methanofastidiosum sp.]|nr:CapA family protein [Methanofastidiosum sp.]
MQLIIAGDLVPTQSNIDLFSNADITALLGEELLSVWNSADIRIFNLEVPLTDKEDPIDKCGPNLIAPTSTVNGIKALNPSLLTLANNHILDQGMQGFKSTQDILNKNEIPFIGVGENLSEASKPYIFQKDGLKIGIYACAEHEFSIATKNTSGANPFDPLESFDHIVTLKSQCDYVIVLYHGGKEHYRFPSPYLQKVCRKMTEKGADLVVCQHSHCIGAYEQYNGSTIIYGQGNFIFDLSESEYWQTGLLVKIIVSGSSRIEFIPICKSGNGIVIANDGQREKILNELEERSIKIRDEEFVEQQYRKLALENRNFYLSQISGFPRWLRGIDKKILHGKLINSLFNKRKLACIRNIIECEAHRELLLKALNE